MSRPRAFGIVASAVSVWAVIANLARLGTGTIGFDEPFYALAGWRYVHGDGNRPPTHGLANFDNFEHPPLAKYLFGLAQLVAGHQSIVADRVVGALCTLAAAAVLGVWLGAVAGRWVGLGAAALVAVLPMSIPQLPFRFGRYGYLDVVAEVFAVAAVALAWLWFRRDGRRGWWFALATGAAVGLASASKENGFLGAVGPVLVGLGLAAARDRAVPVERLLQTLAAVAASVLLFAATYLGLGHPLDAFRFMLRFQQIHADLGHPVAFAGRVSDHPPGWAFLWFAQHGMGSFVAVVAGVCALAAVWLRRDRLVLWCVAALVGPLVFHTLVAGVVLSFYWVMWMPAFVALVALGVAELVGAAGRLELQGARPVLGIACVVVLLGASARDTQLMLTHPAPPHRTTSYAAAVLARTPSVFLRLGERSGTTAADASGHQRDGSYVGAPTLGVPALLTDDADPAVTLYGTTQYVTIAGDAWTNVDAYSVAVWFRTTGRSEYVASHDDFSTSKVWDLLIDASGRLRFQTYDPRHGGGQAAITPGSVADGRRHLVVATRAGNVMTLFVDGKQAATAAFPSFVHGADSLPIELGRRGNGTGYFAGTLDEFAFFDHAFTPADVRALYAAGSLPPAGSS